MKEKLEKLLQNAYSPYYHFPVAAILVMKDGKEINGVNVENANGTSICAERNAVTTAIALGYKKGDFKEIHIMLHSKEHGWPCFSCRQVLVEFMESDALVYSMDEQGNEESHTIKELCPYAFTGDDLK